MSVVVVSGANVELWDAATGERLWERRFGGMGVVCVAVLPDGTVAAGCRSGAVRIGIMEGKEEEEKEHEIVVCRAHTRPVNAVVSLGTRCATGLFASGSDDKTICVWARSGALALVLEVESAVTALCLSPCEQTLAAGCRDGTVFLVDVPTWDQVWTAATHRVAVSSVSFSPNGKWILSGSADATARIISADTGTTVKTYRDHEDRVRSALFSRDGTKILTGSTDSTVRVRRLFPASERKARSLCSALLPQDQTFGPECEALCTVLSRMARTYEFEDNPGEDNHDDYDDDDDEEEEEDDDSMEGFIVPDDFLVMHEEEEEEEEEEEYE